MHYVGTFNAYIIYANLSFDRERGRWTVGGVWSKMATDSEDTGWFRNSAEGGGGETSAFSTYNFSSKTSARARGVHRYSKKRSSVSCELNMGVAGGGVETQSPEQP